MANLWVIAICFDVLSAVLFIIDTVRTRRNDARVEEARGFIEDTDIVAETIGTMTFPAGATRDGMDLNEAVKIAFDGAKMAINKNRENLRKLEKELERSSRFPLVYFALACRLIGTILHFAEGYRQHSSPHPESSKVRVALQIACA